MRLIHFFRGDDFSHSFPWFSKWIFVLGFVVIVLGCQESEDEKGLIWDPKELDFSEKTSSIKQEITAKSEADQVITILNIAAFADGFQLSQTSSWLKHETELPLPYFLLPERRDSVAFISTVSYNPEFLPSNITQAEIELTYRIGDELPQYVAIPVILRVAE